MSSLMLKGDIIIAFVEGLSAIGDKSTVVRLETVENMLVGNFTSNDHASLSDVKLSLEGVHKDGMENTLLGVDLADLQLIPKLVDKDDMVSIKFDEGKCSVAFGPSRRSFKLLSPAEIPQAFTSHPTLTAKWRLPKDIIKPMVDTLRLEGDQLLTVKKNGDGDTSLKFSTKDYGGLNAAEYLVTGEVLREYEGPPFVSMFDFGMFSSVKDIPTDEFIAFRCDNDFPIEMVGVKGPVTSRVMLAPRIVND